MPQPASLIDRWLVRCHGIGAEHQEFLYRCEGCQRLMTWKKIRQGGCSCKSSLKIRPTTASWPEMFRLVVLPWTV